MAKSDREKQVRTYLESVGDALETGFGRRADVEYDYVGEGCLTVADAPFLAEVASEWSRVYDQAWPVDEREQTIAWAPVHAWRALAQLRVAEVLFKLTPFLQLMDENDDDFLYEEFTEVLARLGPTAIPPMRELLDDRTAGEWTRVAAADVIKLVPSFYPEERDEAVAYLTDRLTKGFEQTSTINGTIVSGLMDLNAVESAEVIRKAFQRQVIDKIGAGDWETVRRDLGLPEPPRTRIDRPEPRELARAKKKRERKARKKNRR